MAYFAGLTWQLKVLALKPELFVEVLKAINFISDILQIAGLPIQPSSFFVQLCLLPSKSPSELVKFTFHDQSIFLSSRFNSLIQVESTLMEKSFPPYMIAVGTSAGVQTKTFFVAHAQLIEKSKSAIRIFLIINI